MQDVRTPSALPAVVAVLCLLLPPSTAFAEVTIHLRSRAR